LLRAGLGNVRTVVRFDYSGSGRSLREGSFSWSIDEIVSDLLLLLDHLTLPRVHLYGMSAGTIVGQLFAARYPERVLSLAGYGWCCLNYTRMDALHRTLSERLRHFSDLSALPLTALTKAQFSAIWQRVWTHVFCESDAALPWWFRPLLPLVKGWAYRLIAPTPLRVQYEWFNYLLCECFTAGQGIEAMYNAFSTLPLLIQHARHDSTLPFAMARELHQHVPSSCLTEYERGFNHVSAAILPWQARRVVIDYTKFLSRIPR
jgi:pimeloyl-ACP methyl ester carboxylesterase